MRRYDMNDAALANAASLNEQKEKKTKTKKRNGNSEVEGGLGS